MKRLLCGLLSSVMLICGFGVEASASKDVFESPSLSSMPFSTPNPVQALYTDEEGNTIEVEADYTVTEIAPLSEDGNTIYKLTAYASSPKKGSNDDGVCWATMSVYYEAGDYKAYRIINASGDWSFGNYPGASLSSAYVRFYHGSGYDDKNVYGMNFNVRNPNSYFVRENSCMSSISYRTSASRPLTTLKLSVKVS